MQLKSDTTHAWAELYLPGAGWKGFDPTCGVLAAGHRVRVAVARWPAQAIPVTGTFQGTESDYGRMEVTVDTRETHADAPASSLCAKHPPGSLKR